MFQQALEYESEQAGKEEVARDTVELAVWEKLQLTAETQAELQGLSLLFSFPHPLSTSHSLSLTYPLSTSRSLSLSTLTSSLPLALSLSLTPSLPLALSHSLSPSPPLYLSLSLTLSLTSHSTILLRHPSFVTSLLIERAEQ